jgi:hypothetical protein
MHARLLDALNRRSGRCGIKGTRCPTPALSAKDDPTSNQSHSKLTTKPPKPPETVNLVNFRIVHQSKINDLR